MNQNEKENYGLPKIVFDDLTALFGLRKLKKILKGTITNDEYDLLIEKEAWDANDIESAYLEKLKSEWGIVRKSVIGIATSGDRSSPKMIDSYANAVGGFDILVLETKRREKEPEGNFYHFVIVDVEGYLCVFEGDHCNSSDLKHWFDPLALDHYVKRFK